VLYKSTQNTYFHVCTGGSNPVIRELRIHSPEYRCLGGLTTGMTKEEVFAIIGDPVEIRIGVAIDYGANDVLYGPRIRSTRFST
jgi:hypothetical protein